MRPCQRALEEQYLPLLRRHGSSYRSVNWGSEEGQRKRFEVLLYVGSDDVRTASLLDVGCGVGHLVGYLEANGFTGEYMGVDALPDMVTVARKQYPRHTFEVMDFSEGGGSWHAEYVIGSGLFTYANWDIMRRTLQTMFHACGTAVAWNTLSTWAEEQTEGEFHADPIATLEFCRTLTPWVSLRHDYMPHDFTVYLYREQPAT